MQRFNYFIDVRSGWLEVADVIMGPLKIADQISSGSKHFGGRFYLNNHGDVALFLQAYRAKYGEPEIVHHQEREESWIHMLPAYQPHRLNARTQRLLRLSRVA